jgi:3-deoxy-manno-octulosonate cytidylyltransferase (CMP-KDO synthetase)
MTRRDHATGTDRLAEVAARLDCNVVINVQGDEPLVSPAMIEQVAAPFAADSTVVMTSLRTRLTSRAEYLDPNVVKVVARPDGTALYFSRAPIPWDRDGAAKTPAAAGRHHGSRRHLGLYAYRVAALLRLASTAPAELERRERLEQLRALAMGLVIVVADALELPGPGIDTAEDLARADAILQKARRP